MDGVRRIIVFVKYPEENTVKTRLARDIGARRAAGISRLMAMDAVDAAAKAGREVVIAFSPDDRADAFREWLGGELLYEPQGDGDIGARMRRSFESAFAGGVANAVLVGSDIPDLSSGIIDRAFALLGAHDAVLGPSTDGGYYLIGFTRGGFLSSVFEDIRWSTATVAERTMERFRASGRKYATLPGLRDIDTADDLAAWMAGAASSGGPRGAVARPSRVRRYYEEELAREGP